MLVGGGGSAIDAAGSVHYLDDTASSEVPFWPAPPPTETAGRLLSGDPFVRRAGPRRGAAQKAKGRLIRRPPARKRHPGRRNCKCRRERGADLRRAGEAAVTIPEISQDTEPRHADWFGRVWCDWHSLRDASRARAGHRFRTGQLRGTY